MDDKNLVKEFALLWFNMGQSSVNGIQLDEWGEAEYIFDPEYDFEKLWAEPNPVRQGMIKALDNKKPAADDQSGAGEN